MVDAGVSDLDYLKSRMRQSLADEDAASGSDEDTEDAVTEEGSGDDLEAAEGEDAAGSDEAGETAEAAVAGSDGVEGDTGALAESVSLLIAKCPCYAAASKWCMSGCRLCGRVLSIKSALAHVLHTEVPILAGSGDVTTGPAPQVVAASDAAATIIDTGRLFLRNLAYGTTEVTISSQVRNGLHCHLLECSPNHAHDGRTGCVCSQADLSELLQPFGNVTDVHLVLDK